MEYQISFPITVKFYKKYMKHFPYSKVLKKSMRKDNNFYMFDTESEISYFKLKYKDADVFYSCVNINDNYRQFFHSVDFLALDKLCKEAYSIL